MKLKTPHPQDSLNVSKPFLTPTKVTQKGESKISKKARRAIEAYGQHYQAPKPSFDFSQHKIEKLEDGSSYVGELKSGGVREGYGRMVYKNKSVYEGNWKNGFREGRGRYVSKSGNFYFGDFLNDKKEGDGVEIEKDGSYFLGQWKNDEQAKGKGIVMMEGGSHYEGQLRDGNLHGTGMLKFADGRVYKGEFFKGVIEGRGNA